MEDESFSCFVGDQQLSVTLARQNAPEMQIPLLLLELLEPTTCTIHRASVSDSDAVNGLASIL